MRYAEWKQFPGHWIEKTPGGQLRYVAAHVEDERMLPLPLSQPKAQRPRAVIVVQEHRSSQGCKTQSYQEECGQGECGWAGQLLRVGSIIACVAVAIWFTSAFIVPFGAATATWHTDPIGSIDDLLFKSAPVFLGGIIVPLAIGTILMMLRDFFGDE